MRIDGIKAGDRIEITLRRDKSRLKVYISQVEDILDSVMLIVHMPISYGRVVKLPKNEVYSFLFLAEKGMVRYDTEILEEYREDGFYLMKVKLISDGEKMQRREFFRFSCLLPIKFSVISESFQDVTDNMMAEGVIKDVGGGGIRFVANDQVEEGSKIKCLILLNDDYLILIGKVLQRQFFPKSTYKFQYRAQFLGILPEEQDKIVQFIFAEQRKNLQKFGF